MELLTVAAAIAWVGLIVNVVVIPFFNKGEKLHQDYVAKGEIDAAIAAIESNRFIPTLARIFQRARDAQQDKRSRLDMDAMEELLQDVDFLPDLEELDAALKQKATLSQCLTNLDSLATRLWKWGLVHAAITLALPFAWPGLGMAEPWDLVVAIVLTIASMTTLVWTVRRMFQFHGQMDAFLRCLRHAKEGGNV